MGGLLDLKGHLVFYRSYHFHEMNVAIHLVCIPIILLSANALLTKYSLQAHPYLNLGIGTGVGYGLFYSILDWRLGIPTLGFLVAFNYFFSTLYYYQATAPLAAFNQTNLIHGATIAHIVSWLAQFYGHGVYEKRAPALKDNLLQALVLAPFFVVFEIAFWLGYRLDLKKYMDNEAGKRVRDYKLAQANSKKTN